MRWVLIVLMLGMMGAAPATRPATVADLRAVIAKLQAEIDRLRAENGELREKLATTQPVVGDEITKAIAEHRLAVGMTLEQARAVTGSNGVIFEEGEGYQVIRWQGLPAYSPGAADGGSRSVGGSLNSIPATPTRWARFDGGKITRHGMGR